MKIDFLSHIEEDLNSSITYLKEEQKYIPIKDKRWWECQNSIKTCEDVLDQITSFRVFDKWKGMMVDLCVLFGLSELDMQYLEPGILSWMVENRDVNKRLSLEQVWKSQTALRVYRDEKGSLPTDRQEFYDWGIEKKIWNK